MSTHLHSALAIAVLLFTATLLAREVVRYRDFGAKGDGKTDDHPAIVAAHEYANARGLPVRAEDNAVYYLGPSGVTATIMTDVDFGKAKFIVDDARLPFAFRNRPIFRVVSDQTAYNPRLQGPLKAGQRGLGRAFKCRTMIIVADSTRRHFIRHGANQNNGVAATDCFIVDQKGDVDPATPIVWDFAAITSSTAIPLAVAPRTIRGGHFTTIANQAPSKYTYYSRNIQVMRPNTTIEGLTHLVVGEGEHGAPYSAFLNVSNAADITIRDCVVTGHKTYKTIGAAGTPVNMGSYDLGATKSINVSFIRIRQSNSILDSRYWGVLGTNYCKNLLYDRCELSRFDAHCGVCNATIRNSVLGHSGVNLIGYGTFLIENTTVHGRNMLHLRPDYGAFWRGDIIIRNCIFQCRDTRQACIINGGNSGQHDFGYECRMPTTVTIDGLRIDDQAIRRKGYRGPCVFTAFNPKYKPGDKEQFPYIRTRAVVVRGLRTASGKPLSLTTHPPFFQGTALRIQK